MCKRCMEGMLNCSNNDVTDLHGKLLKRSRRHLIKKMTKTKIKLVIDFRTCHHDTKEGFQEESDFTYLKKLNRDALQKSGKAHSLLDKTRP